MAPRAIDKSLNKACHARSVHWEVEDGARVFRVIPVPTNRRVRTTRLEGEARYKPIDFDIDLKGEKTAVSDCINDCTASRLTVDLNTTKACSGACVSTLSH